MFLKVGLFRFLKYVVGLHLAQKYDQGVEGVYTKIIPYTAMMNVTKL